MPDPSHPMPSAEAIEAAVAAAIDSEDGGDSYADAFRAILAAAYAVDMPAMLNRAVEQRENANAVSSRLEAERPRLVAEAKRERTAEIVEVMRREERGSDWPWMADFIEAHFNEEAPDARP